MADTIDDVIERAALDGVDTVSADGVSVKAMDIEKQIMVADRKSSKIAAGRNHCGIRPLKARFGDCG